jgi:hypothetical protein
MIRTTLTQSKEKISLAESRSTHLNSILKVTKNCRKRKKTPASGQKGGIKIVLLSKAISLGKLRILT